MYRPREPFTTVVKLVTPNYKSVKGVIVKEWTVLSTFSCSFKTYGGTESVVNDQLTVVDTAEIETWYMPQITSGCRIKLGDKVYEVIGEPENIEQRNQFMKFKVRGVKGGA